MYRPRAQEYVTCPSAGDVMGGDDDDGSSKPG